MNVAQHYLILVKHIFIAICASSSIYQLTLNSGVRLDKRYEITKKILSYVLVPMPIYYSIKFYWFGAIDEMPYLFSFNTLFAGSVAFSVLSALTEHFFKIDHFNIWRFVRTFVSTLLFFTFYGIARLLEDDVQSISWGQFFATWDNLPQLIRFIHSLVLISNICYFARSFFRKRNEYLAELSDRDRFKGTELAQWATKTYLIVLAVFSILVITLFSSNIYLYCLFILAVGISFLTQTVRCFNFFNQWSDRSAESKTEQEPESPVNNDKLRLLIEESMLKNRYYSIPGITADDVAQKIGIPRNKLNNYLKLSVNANFNQWIQQHRIDEAKQIFDNRSDMSIAELAQYLGYSDVAMFSRSFKNLIGIPPREYRKRAQEKIEPELSVTPDTNSLG